ncbi:MAG: DUF542 domain-containing protein [Solirubrobacterales bacterium]
MTPIEPERTLSELVLEQPGRVRIFEELQFDYCCGGDRSLAATATERGLDLRTLVLLLEAQERALGASQPERDWREATFTELCDHIVDVHHAYLRRELPATGELLAKVVSRHGETLPQLTRLESVFDNLQGALIVHLDQEEEVLFPLCRSLDEDADGKAAGGGSPQLGMHEAAHTAVGQALATMRELGGDYRPEQALCTSHGVLLESLATLERDLHQHIHEENNVLFPRLRARLGEAQAPLAT